MTPALENAFPGYDSDIHGIGRTAPDRDGSTYFATYVINEYERWDVRSERAQYNLIILDLHFLHERPPPQNP